MEQRKSVVPTHRVRRTASMPQRRPSSNRKPPQRVSSINSEPGYSNIDGQNIGKERHRYQRRKSVQFDMKSSNYNIVPGIHDFTEQECSSMWYSTEDFEDFKHQIRVQLSMKSQSDGNSTWIAKEDICFRGLRDEADLLKLQFHYNEILKSIHREKDRQSLLGSDDPETLRAIVQFWTKEATDKAIALAKQDRAEVSKQYSESCSKPRTAVDLYTKKMMQLSPSAFLPLMSSNPMVLRPKEETPFDLASIVDDVLSTLEAGDALKDD